DVSTNYEVVDASTLRYWGADVHAYENFTIVAGWSVGLVTHGGLVKVNSEPRAEILIDGEKSGLTTPAVLEENMEIDSGQHAISVEKFGWQIMGQSEQEVTVEPNRIEPVNFELKQTAWFRILKVLPWLIPLLVLIYLIREWQARPRIRKTIIAQYKPPDDLAPAQVCALTHGQPRPRAITAMLIDLAYRGYIKIIEKQEKKWWGKKTDYAFEKMKEFKKDGALADYEETLLHKIFGDKNRVSLDTLKGQTSRQSLSRAFIRIKKNIQDKLKDQEYFKKKSFQSKYVALILLGIFVFVAGTFSFAAAFLVSLPYTLVATGVLLVIGGIILPQPLTTKGLEAKWWALGFKEYLQVAERFRLGACTPETFEKFLSYAIVFGVEDKWAGRFADIYKESPDWYEGQGAITAFNVAAFTKGISSMSGAVASSFSCSESSASGSSGFGGGGSAGGGGGGGGSSAG
ncbi:DUF2207 domain-containing protein, partial [Patescibacteria group bacterium]|nr:DUF2207 domain-containing protein [Patescibacteria group bacterium]